MRRTRWRIGALVAGLALVAGACSGSGASTSRSTGGAEPCTLVRRLRHSADDLRASEVADPVAFGRSLDTAVRRYLDTVDELEPRVPADLARDLQTLHAAVEQHRFQDALAARRPLDDWAERVCNLAPPTSTTTLPTAS